MKSIQNKDIVWNSKICTKRNVKDLEGLDPEDPLQNWERTEQGSTVIVNIL